MSGGFDVGYRPRQVVSWMHNGCGNRLYGVVMNADKAELSVVPLYVAMSSTKFYDKGGADESRDAHNVLMLSCPPPGTALCNASEIGKCFAYADPKVRERIPLEDASYLRLRLDDGGKKISEQDYKDILDHLWRDEKQKTRPAAAMSATERLQAMVAGMESSGAEADYGYEP